jgi:hypothetical protein
MFQLFLRDRSLRRLAIVYSLALTLASLTSVRFLAVDSCETLTRYQRIASFGTRTVEDMTFAGKPDVYRTLYATLSPGATDGSLLATAQEVADRVQATPASRFFDLTVVEIIVAIVFAALCAIVSIAAVAHAKRVTSIARQEILFVGVQPLPIRVTAMHFACLAVGLTLGVLCGWAVFTAGHAASSPTSFLSHSSIPLFLLIPACLAILGAGTLCFLGTITLFSLRKQATTPQGRCPNCLYELSEPSCPECGWGKTRAWSRANVHRSLCVLAVLVASASLLIALIATGQLSLIRLSAAYPVFQSDNARSMFVPAGNVEVVLTTAGGDKLAVIARHPTQRAPQSSARVWFMDTATQAWVFLGDVALLQPSMFLQSPLLPHSIRIFRAPVETSLQMAICFEPEITERSDLPTDTAELLLGGVSQGDKSD